eukprot:5006563-Pyramimonas_sp.AAC.1
MNVSPLREGFYRPAVTSGDGQPSIPAVVEGDEMVGQPASCTELILQDTRDEGLLDVPKPPESIFVRPRSNASSRGRPKIPRPGARSTSRSNSTISIAEACWNPNVDCAPQAEIRCPGKAGRPEGACRHQ